MATERQEQALTTPKTSNLPFCLSQLVNSKGAHLRKTGKFPVLEQYGQEWRCFNSLLNRSHPIPRPSADFDVGRLHGNVDIMPATFVFVTRVVRDDVLAVQL